MHGRVGANGAFRVGTQGPLSEAAAASDGQIDVPAHIDIIIKHIYIYIYIRYTLYLMAEPMVDPAARRGTAPVNGPQRPDASQAAAA